MSEPSMQLTLAQIHQCLPGSRLVGDAQLMVDRVHTDSRSLQAQDLFVALQGERFDAHDFLAQLPALGVRAAIAKRGLAQAGLSGLEVDEVNQVSASGIGSHVRRNRHTIQENTCLGNGRS